jgi:hypothetical protein
VATILILDIQCDAKPMQKLGGHLAYYIQPTVLLASYIISTTMCRRTCCTSLPESALATGEHCLFFYQLKSCPRSRAILIV